MDDKLIDFCRKYPEVSDLIERIDAVFRIQFSDQERRLKPPFVISDYKEETQLGIFKNYHENLARAFKDVEAQFRWLIKEYYDSLEK